MKSSNENSISYKTSKIARPCWRSAPSMDNINFFYNNKPNNVGGKYYDFKIKRWKC